MHKVEGFSTTDFDVECILYETELIAISEVVTLLDSVMVVVDDWWTIVEDV